jgi:hypothetical protein
MADLDFGSMVSSREELEDEHGKRLQDILW